MHTKNIYIYIYIYHKKCHNFIDIHSDKCLCNHGLEDTNHFLFSCPFFAAQKATLASRMQSKIGGILKMQDLCRF